MKATTGRTVTALQRDADMQRLKTPEGQAKMDALRSSLSAALQAKATAAALELQPTRKR
jgi:hypothetical protein